jgi:3-methyl-2-oxobutanoate hydroxymethyltransferase
MERPITVPSIRARKGKKRLVMVTAYDAPTTRWSEAAGADMLLVGDSLAMVVLGYETTLSVTLDEMLHHAKAVTRASNQAFVVGDLPFGSYQVSLERTLEAGIRFLKEAHVHAVKLEGLWPDRVEALVRIGVPVMGHLGLTPQAIRTMGGYKVQGRTFEDAQHLVKAAIRLEEAGCFALVLEGVPAEVASVITKTLAIPTIGIGAGISCDGQVLVIHDLLGITAQPLPRFVTPYAQLSEEAVAALQRWIEDVRNGRIPTEKQSYHLSDETAALWRETHSEA